MKEGDISEQITIEKEEVTYLKLDNHQAAQTAMGGKGTCLHEPGLEYKSREVIVRLYKTLISWSTVCSSGTIS